MEQKQDQEKKAFRSAGDIVSALSSNSSNMKTVGKHIYNPLSAHNISNIKHNKIYI